MLIGGLAVSADPRIGALELAPGAPLPPVEVVELFAAGPGARMVRVPLREYLKKNESGPKE
jgi:hypothetical protein